VVSVVATDRVKADGTDRAVEAPPRKAPAGPIDAAQVHEAVRKVKESLDPNATSIEFVVDADSHSIVVKVIDKQTRQLIRQIPSEEMLAIAKSVDKLEGLLVREKA